MRLSAPLARWLHSRSALLSAVLLGALAGGYLTYQLASPPSLPRSLSLPGVERAEAQSAQSTLEPRPVLVRRVNP